MKTEITKRNLVLGLFAAIITVSAPALNSDAMANAGGGGGGGGREGLAIWANDDYFTKLNRQNRIRNFHRRENARSMANRTARAARAAARRAARNARRAANRVRAANRRAARRAARGRRFAANPTWASSTDRRTGVTTTSVGQPNGSRQVTVTNANGAVIDSYVSN